MTSSDFEIQLEGTLFKADESYIFLVGKKQVSSEDAQYFWKSFCYLFTDGKLLLSFYFCKCPSVNCLGQDLDLIFSCLNFTLALLIVVPPQRFSSYSHSGRKHQFLGYNTLAIQFGGKRKDRTYYLALLSVHSSLFRHR